MNIQLFLTGVTKISCYCTENISFNKFSMEKFTNSWENEKDNIKTISAKAKWNKKAKYFSVGEAVFFISLSPYLRLLIMFYFGVIELWLWLQLSIIIFDTSHCYHVYRPFAIQARPSLQFTPFSYVLHRFYRVSFILYACGIKPFSIRRRQ